MFYALQSHPSYWIPFWHLYIGLFLLIWEYLLLDGTHDKGFRESSVETWLGSVPNWGLLREDSRWWGGAGGGMKH